MACINPVSVSISGRYLILICGICCNSDTIIVFPAFRSIYIERIRSRYLTPGKGNPVIFCLHGLYAAQNRDTLRIDLLLIRQYIIVGCHRKCCLKSSRFILLIACMFKKAVLALQEEQIIARKFVIPCCIYVIIHIAESDNIPAMRRLSGRSIRISRNDSGRNSDFRTKSVKQCRISLTYRIPIMQCTIGRIHIIVRRHVCIMVGIISNGIHDIIINAAYLFVFCLGCRTQIQLRNDLCHTPRYILLLFQRCTIQHTDPVYDRIIAAILLLPCHICHMVIQIISCLRIPVLIICKCTKQDIPDILLTAVFALCQFDSKDFFSLQHLAAHVGRCILQRCVALRLRQQICCARNCID